MEVSPKLLGFGTIAIISTILCCGIITSVHGNYVCDFYDCGNGVCKDSSVYPYWRCECKHGWRRPLSENKSLSYLPCTIPACTLNYGCSEVLYPSATSQVSRSNLSDPDQFNPCEWDVCGAGTCVKKPHGSHTCLCHQGYQNLMNSKTGYCVAECYWRRAFTMIIMTALVYFQAGGITFTTIIMTALVYFQAFLVRIRSRLCSSGYYNRWNFIENSKSCGKRHQLRSGLASSFCLYNFRVCKIGEGLCTSIDCKALHHLGHRLLHRLKI